MPDNFVVTAERMHDSSKKLHESDHYHNACYLAGYVGECYLKLLVSTMRTILPSPGLRTPLRYRHGVSNMNRDLQHVLSTSGGLGTLRPYLIDMAVNCPNLHNWNPGTMRYDDTSQCGSRVVSASFQQEQEMCFHQVAAMYVAGIIS